MHIDNEDNITKENLSLLIKTAINFVEEHNENIKKINVIKDHKNRKHLKSISALDTRISRYLKAIRQEQEKIAKFKRIAASMEIELDLSENKLPVIPQEEIQAINKNTGESVNLSQEEIDFLRELSGE